MNDSVMAPVQPDSESRRSRCRFYAKRIKKIKKKKEKKASVQDEILFRLHFNCTFKMFRPPPPDLLFFFFFFNIY